MIQREYSCWLNDSFILNPEECEDIVNLTIDRWDTNIQSYKRWVL